MSERRFSEDEVAAIFARATEGPQSGAQHLSSGDGMTLAQIQEIGREVGIPAESLAIAARTIDQVGPALEHRFLGLPVGVGRTINLDRKLSDAEWEQFVVLLREKFNARGVMKSEGSLRQWTNGNLQALLEPTATGQRIRLRTIKTNAMGTIVAGSAALGMSTVLVALASFQGALSDTGMLVALAFLGIVGAGMIGSTVLRLPRWARTRKQQMAELAEQVAGDPTLKVIGSTE